MKIRLSMRGFHGVESAPPALPCRIRPETPAVRRRRMVAAEFRLVEHLAESVAGSPHQPAKVGKCGDRREVLQIALEVGADVSVEPDGTFPVGAEMQGRRRKAATPGHPQSDAAASRGSVVSFIP
jgi:hypothetical protein